ncbi:Uncharacterised protein [uncultured archaeon]|nr:Uncharacterised protein [uncultured archaeon]
MLPKPRKRTKFPRFAQRRIELEGKSISELRQIARSYGWTNEFIFGKRKKLGGELRVNSLEIFLPTQRHEEYVKRILVKTILLAEKKLIK